LVSLFAAERGRIEDPTQELMRLNVFSH